MIEKAFKGNHAYWLWIIFLSVVIAVGGVCYLRQYFFGLAINPLNEIVEYYPTANEIAITLGIWSTGSLLLTMLYKIVLTVEQEA